MTLFHLIPWFPGILLILLCRGEAQEQARNEGETSSCVEMGIRHTVFKAQDNVGIFAGPWKTAYYLEAEHKITRNKLLATIPLLKKEWKVSFDFKANKFKGFQQILHMTVGGKGAGRGAKHGDRTPAIWAHSSKGFLVSSSVGGKSSFSKYFKTLPSAGEWINIEVVQQMEASEIIYTIYIGGELVFSTRNSKPLAFENVKIFASSSWYSPVSGYIRSLLIQNKNDGRSILFCLNNVDSLQKVAAYLIGQLHSPFQRCIC